MIFAFSHPCGKFQTNAIFSTLQTCFYEMFSLKDSIMKSTLFGANLGPFMITDTLEKKRHPFFYKTESNPW